MSDLLFWARVVGTPGPKGSLVGFCTAACCRNRKPAVVLKEQSEAGVRFRKVVARSLRGALDQTYAGPIETRPTLYVVQRTDAKGVVWPSHDGPYPTHRNSGDVEKHGRVVHDALMDARLIEDDSQVWRTVIEKRWATSEHPAGLELEVFAA